MKHNDLYINQYNSDSNQDFNSKHLNYMGKITLTISTSSLHSTKEFHKRQSPRNKLFNNNSTESKVERYLYLRDIAANLQKLSPAPNSARNKSHQTFLNPTTKVVAQDGRRMCIWYNTQAVDQVWVIVLVSCDYTIYLLWTIS